MPGGLLPGRERAQLDPVRDVAVGLRKVPRQLAE